MAQKLKNLNVTKVDFVDEGANPRADIKLFKRKEVEEPVQEAFNDEALTDSIMKKITDGLSGMLRKWKVEKGEATSFREKMNEVSTEKIREEIWSVCYALQQSLGSIVSDEDLDSGEAYDLLCESIDDFHESILQYASTWSSGKSASIKKNFEAPDHTEFSMIVTAHKNLGEIIEKTRKGESEEMLKIDKSKMTPEERTAYEEIVKKYAVDTEGETVNKKTTEKTEETEDGIQDGGVEKGRGDHATTETSVSSDSGDIYKGLHPAVKAEMEALRKFREDTEIKELTEVAKKYELIGKKPEELIPTLKSLRAAGGTAYDDMIGILDATLNAVQQSGIFGEIGKSREGTGGTTREEVIAKVRAKTAEIKKSRPDLTDAQAMDEVLLANPELRAELDKITSRNLNE